MGRCLAVYLCTLAFVAVLVARSDGYPSPNRQDNNSTSAIEAEVSASDSQPVAQATHHIDYIDDTNSYLGSDLQTGQTQIFEQQTEKFYTSAEPITGSQTFFPSFQLFNNQPLGHSRPFLYQQEAAYSQRPGAYRQQQLYDSAKFNNPFRRENFQIASDTSQNLLGSGNFGVLRGGTFYNENENSDLQDYNTGRYNSFVPFYHNNGHGRPSFYFGATNPRPHQHDQFANFRDFADINTPTSAYSQYVVVYVNRNGSRVEKAASKKVAEPKNIIERLAMLDLENKKTKRTTPSKRLSASKRKLALLPPEKKIKNKIVTTTPSADLYEPLLALS